MREVCASRGLVKKALQGRMTVKCIKDDAAIEETLCFPKTKKKQLPMSSTSIKETLLSFVLYNSVEYLHGGSENV